MIAQNRIIFVACYIGKLPPYFELFLKTCAKNAEFDFLLVIDQPLKCKLPKNVTCLALTLEEISSIASMNIGISIKINSAYKLCDFKPAYGIIFSEYIKNYTFWAHIDIDIILGKISSFITKDILNNYDVISVRPEYISGFFAIYRNNNFINSLFKLSKDYVKIFQSDKHYCFDECNFLWLPLLNGCDINSLYSEIDSMTHLVKRLAKENTIKAYFDLHVLEGLVNKLEWCNGYLIYEEYEILLYHLIKLKGIPNAKFPDLTWNKIRNKFTVYEKCIEIFE